jgi:16S rRNA G966 N2-methylase RsmD
VGIEALSRGAKAALFIDLEHSAIETIRENLKLTNLATEAQVVHGDALAILERPAPMQFDYLYIAPPQYKGLWSRALKLVDNHLTWLSEDAWVIVQIDPGEVEDLDLVQLAEFDRRKYGSTLLIFFQVG